MSGKMVLVVGRDSLAADVKDMVSTLGLGIVQETDTRKVQAACTHHNVALSVLDEDLCHSIGTRSGGEMIRALRNSGKDFIAVSSRGTVADVLEAKNNGAADLIFKPYIKREFILRINAVLQGKTRITCIGGGTGLFHVLAALKTLPGTLLTSIVSMSDDGGSSGRLKASFGVLPPGDIRRSLVALSNAPEVMNDLMCYRFQKGDGIKGHSVGNLFLTALSDIKGSLDEAVRALSDILHVQGIVLPVTDMQTTLCARFEDDTVVSGESRIDLCEDRDPELRIVQLWQDPCTECVVDAYAAIINSDIVLIGPGDLFTSVITNFLVKGIREALARSSAKKAYICNLMTKPGETAGFSAVDHVGEIVKYLGRDCLDFVIISDTPLSERAIREYAKKGQVPVIPGNIDDIRRITQAEIVLANVGHEEELVRHDNDKLRKAVKMVKTVLRR